MYSYMYSIDVTFKSNHSTDVHSAENLGDISHYILYICSGKTEDAHCSEHPPSFYVSHTIYCTPSDKSIHPPP